MKRFPLRIASIVALASLCFWLDDSNVMHAQVGKQTQSKIQQAKTQTQAKDQQTALIRPAPGATLSPDESDLLTEINFVRTRPVEFAALLEQLKSSYDGNLFKNPSGKTIITQEGWKAVDEAIKVLRSMKPVAALDVSGGLCFGAGELARDQKQSGQTGHKGSDGSFCEDRVMRFGTWTSPIGENLSYGNHSARERIFNLIIDDGVSSRNHRNRLLDPAFKVAGIACGEHNSWGGVCVITLAGGFKEQSNRPTTTTAPKPAALKGAMKF